MNRLIRELMWRWDCLVGDLRGNSDYPGCSGCARARFQHVGLWPDTLEPLEAWCDRCFRRTGRLTAQPHVSFAAEVVGATQAEADEMVRDMVRCTQVFLPTRLSCGQDRED